MKASSFPSLIFFSLTIFSFSSFTALYKLCLFCSSQFVRSSISYLGNAFTFGISLSIIDLTLSNSSYRFFPSCDTNNFISLYLSSIKVLSLSSNIFLFSSSCVNFNSTLLSNEDSTEFFSSIDFSSLFFI